MENDNENRFLFVINIIKGFLVIIAALVVFIVYCSKACYNLIKWIGKLFKKNESGGIKSDTT